MSAEQSIDAKRVLIVENTRVTHEGVELASSGWEVEHNCANQQKPAMGTMNVEVQRILRDGEYYKRSIFTTDKNKAPLTLSNDDEIASLKSSHR